MLTAAQRATMIPSSPPSQPRLVLAPVRASRAILDGGWWPRSWDPVAELPGLLLALSDRYGRIRNVILNNGAWDSRFRRLAVGTDVVRVGWFDSLDTALLIATTDRGDQLDLLVVPPDSTAAAAEQAMTTAADPTNTRHAPDILTAGTAPPSPTTGTDPDAVWDNEGGNTATRRPHHRPTNVQSRQVE
ncbi:DUF5994 family protein [Plantactinospora sp. B6F1]|uniref:DUF5994 family protein n=1 Tax=Plantactinospora sp. B6F1 TaxID=3158971 RepID=UPI0032D9360E